MAIKLKDIQRDEKEKVCMFTARVKPETKEFLQSKKIDLDKLVEAIKHDALRGKTAP